MTEPGSPTKRKSPETVAATIETKAPPGTCPVEVPLARWYEHVRSALFDPQDGSPLDYDGLASNVHAIFVGLKRDVDSLTKYVARNKGRRFPSSHLDLFRQNVTNVRDKIKSIWVALFGQSSPNLDAIDAELYDVLSRL